MSHAGDMLYIVPTHCRRRPGCQRTSYLSYLQRLLWDAEDDINLKMPLPLWLPNGLPEENLLLPFRSRLMMMRPRDS